MNRATTPVLGEHEIHTHHPTPTRAKIQGAIEFCEAMNIFYFKQDVCRVFDVIKQAGWQMLTESNRTRHNAEGSEIRGRYFIFILR